ncbi:MAG TPA: TIR domain-containing protein [Pyrinomonadaceae bacterium]|nr:TIR domain-containing protein [Pyrinomonadaceae bacterium]
MRNSRKYVASPSTRLAEPILRKQRNSDTAVTAVDLPEKYRLRTRQNVILELGYFIRVLGRQRVAAIYQQDVEIPSDYSGVLFIPHDESGIWQLRLANEIRARE